MIITTTDHIHIGIFDDSLGKNAIITTATITANALTENHTTPFDTISYLNIDNSFFINILDDYKTGGRALKISTINFN